MLARVPSRGRSIRRTRESVHAVQDLPPRVLSLLAVAGAIATFATAAGEAFPDWVAQASLGIAVTLALAAVTAFCISSYPDSPLLFWVPRRWKAVPLATHRRRLINGEKVPVSESDFEIVWQSWCDELTGLLRGSGFPRDRNSAPPDSDHDTRLAKVLGEYHKPGGLRIRAVRHVDEAWDRPIADVTRKYREQFYGPTTAQALWDLTDEVYVRFIGPVARRKEARHDRPQGPGWMARRLRRP
jgi:hypothetical protein